MMSIGGVSKEILGPEHGIFENFDFHFSGDSGVEEVWVMGGGVGVRLGRERGGVVGWGSICERVSSYFLFFYSTFTTKLIMS